MDRQEKIIDGAETAAIYVRKSKATDKGESIENQISRCISLCEMRGFGYRVFTDYDFTGKNTNRPDYELMIRGLSSGEYKYLICYRLDRVSRSVNDFSALIEELTSYEAGFISIKENFDTISPMGRAMMMITAVFAQLERETIAERVRDNMIDRAKAGKWNGGPVPYGFNSKTETTEYRGGDKKASYLVIDTEQADRIREFYSWYLEDGGSVRNVAIRANEMGYKTGNDKHWASSQMSRILQSPLYAAATVDTYHYFKNNTQVDIIDKLESFNSENGLMYYNRRKPHKNTSKEREQEEWILAIGEHKPIISGEVFIQAQKKLFKNKTKAPRLNQGIRSPLTGLVRCGKCNSSMSVFASPKTNSKDNGYYNYFRCLRKEQQASFLCDNKNVRADVLEDLVVSHIVGLLENKNSLKSILEATNQKNEDNTIPLIAKRNKHQSELDKLEKELENLVDALSKGILPEKIITKKYAELEDKKIKLQILLKEIENELNINYSQSFDLQSIEKSLNNFKESYEYLSFEDRKKILAKIVKEIKVTDNNIELSLYFLPIESLDSQSLWLHTDKRALPKGKIIKLKGIINDINTLPEKTIADRIKKLRLKNNLTKKQLAISSNLNSNTIVNYEKSRTTPNDNSIKSLSQALNTTPSYLLGIK